MFDPIRASKEIKDSYVDYITTTFHLADAAYERDFKRALQKDGMVAKGPFLDIGGSYETGESLSELMERGIVSRLFQQLEPVEESRKELKLNRPLYTHQNRAVELASSGTNLVVTTGTGSGKTECFLLPIINQLLREEEADTLGPGVRAIIIYPMNALANDQMRRMRTILKQYPKICFGLYNGNTEHTHARALAEYRRTYHDPAGNPLSPLPNEIISREEMQNTPPHILITNYSMLEYMMLRPRDDLVFSGAKLKFIVLDEAHIYKGATGMETSILMRRLRARISRPDSVQYILTSATLGGPDADEAILSFAEKLCGVSFDKTGIIRSTEKRPRMKELRDFPPALFESILNNSNSAASVLERYQADFAPSADDSEKLYELCLHSRLFAVLRNTAVEPITISELRRALNEVTPITDQQVTAFVAVCARAEKNGANLIKPRYHFFVRALEGAFVTLNTPKRLYLQRKNRMESEDGVGVSAVFEAAICSDCGRLAIVGKNDGKTFRQSVRNLACDDAEYYLIREQGDVELGDSEDVESAYDGKDDEYVVCPVCGALSSDADTHFKPLCGHASSNYAKVYQAKMNRSGAKCPACNFGILRRFYLGSEAATAVLGTELYIHVLLSASPLSIITMQAGIPVP